MRVLLATALMLVLVTGCEDERVPVATEPASDYCSELEVAAADDDFTGVEAPQDLTAAEAEGYRLLTEPGLGPPDEPREEQAVLAFSTYLETACPGLVADVFARLPVRTDPISEPTPSEVPPSPAPSLTDNGPFCASWVAMAGESIDAVDRGLSEQVRTFQAWLVEVTSGDLADELPADARAGLDVFAGLIGPLDPDTVTERDLDRLEQQLTAQQERDTEAYDTWLDQNCGF